jgi:butyryl-CoA dehydrogenase
MIAARATGAAERALTLASNWANERVQSGGVIASHQLIGAMIADSVCDIALCRTLTHQVAWEADSGMPRKLLHAKAAMVKLTASEAAGRVIDRALQIFGGRGYMRENPVERLYRDIRVDRIWEGTSEIQRMIIAGEARKRGLDGLLQYGAALPAEAGVHA